MSEYLLYLILGGLLAIAVGAGYIWKKGYLGTANEARLKKLRADFATWAKNELDHFDDRIAAKIAANKAPPVLTDIVARNRTDSIAAAFDLMNKGAINKEQYDTIVTGIMKG